MWRLPVRCDDRYRDYANGMFHATYLDRNQIIRAMMFSAPFNEVFHAHMKKYLKADTSPPFPLWKPSDHGLWMEQTYPIEKEGGGVNVESRTRKETRIAPEPHRSAVGNTDTRSTSGRSGEVYGKSETIKIRFG
jgi:hypothetical protein